MTWASCTGPPCGKSRRRTRRKSPALEFLNLPMSLLQILAVTKAGWATWVMVCALHEAWFTTGVHCNHPNPLPISRVNASRWPCAKLNPPESCDTLFISERRKPLSRCTVWLMINQVARKAGLEHLEIHPHMLRHSCGYALVNKGTDIRIIQGYLDTEVFRRRLATLS